MRSNRNSSGSVIHGVGERNAAPGDRSAGETGVIMPARMPAKMPASRMPMEWLDSGSWRLPSGKALAEFALQAGFLAPLMLRGTGLRGRGPKTESSYGLSDRAGAKQFKGESR
jgi:hypothetical protein